MQASQIFNGYIGSHLCYHLSHFGIFNLFENKSEINLSTVDKSNFSHYQSKSHDMLIEYAVKFGVFYWNKNNNLVLTPLGHDLKKNSSFFTWAVGGYGNFFRNFTTVDLNNNDTFHPLIDGANVALGSRQANKAFMWKTILTELEKLNLNNIIDLGCGSAGALIDICKIFNQVSAIGIDINSKAIDEANVNVANNNMVQRIALYNHNVLDAIDNPAMSTHFSEVGTVLSFMMMHDLFNVQSPIAVMHKLRSVFPQATSFLIADTFISDEKSINNNTPIFSYGFEYVHHFMNIKIFKKKDYIDFFSEAGFIIKKIQYLNVPNTYLFVLE